MRMISAIIYCNCRIFHCVHVKHIHIPLKLRMGYHDSFRGSFMTNCDLLCQNLPLTHAMAKISFHCQWIAPSIN